MLRVENVGGRALEWADLAEPVRFTIDGDGEFVSVGTLSGRRSWSDTGYKAEMSADKRSISFETTLLRPGEYVEFSAVYSLVDGNLAVAGRQSGHPPLRLQNPIERNFQQRVKLTMGVATLALALAAGSLIALEGCRAVPGRNGWSAPLVVRIAAGMMAMLIAYSLAFQLLKTLTDVAVVGWAWLGASMLMFAVAFGGLVMLGDWIVRRYGLAKATSPSEVSTPESNSESTL